MATWLPEHERDTSYYLFRNLFRCRVPFIQTLSKEYIKHFGMPESGDAFRNKQMANELTDRMLTIAQMAEYYDNGVQVYVCKKEDTKKIYDLITDHLMAWRDRIENSFNPGNPPIKDLILLDRFANAVYAHAKYQFTQEIADSLMARHMASIIGFTPENLIPKTNTQITTVTEEENLPERESMADVFARRLKSPSGNNAKGFGKWN